MKKKELSKKQLLKLYQENDIREVAATLNISLPTLYNYLKRAGIPHKGRKGRHFKYVLVD